MVKQCLSWKPVKCRNGAGDIVRIPIPELIDIHYRGTLVSHIFSMLRKKPISFDAAINIVSEKLLEAFAAGRMGQAPEHYSWYTDNFIEFIADLGYHIELTGEEFESFALSDLVA